MNSIIETGIAVSAARPRRAGPVGTAQRNPTPALTASATTNIPKTSGHPRMPAERAYCQKYRSGNHNAMPMAATVSEEYSAFRLRRPVLSMVIRKAQATELTEMITIPIEGSRTSRRR